MSFYSQNELESIGFKLLGQNVCISRKASIYNPGNIEIGDNSRIDDFCLLSASSKGIKIGRNVHIAAFSSIIGAEYIELGDYSGLSSRVSLYSSSDDYSGEYMTNPTVEKQYTNVNSKPVVLGKHVIVGSGSVILPGVYLEEGVAVGALSLINRSFSEFLIVAGNPARKINSRKRQLIQLESEYNKNQK